jgi:hypothetical protein
LLCHCVDSSLRRSPALPNILKGSSTIDSDETVDRWSVFSQGCGSMSYRHELLYKRTWCSTSNSNFSPKDEASMTEKSNPVLLQRNPKMTVVGIGRLDRALVTTTTQRRRIASPQRLPELYIQSSVLSTCKRQCWLVVGSRDCCC